MSSVSDNLFAGKSHTTSNHRDAGIGFDPKWKLDSKQASDKTYLEGHTHTLCNECEFSKTHSILYEPYENWSKFSDSDDEGAERAEVPTEDPKLKVYTIKDMKNNHDLLRIGRKFYSRTLLRELLKVTVS